MNHTFDEKKYLGKERLYIPVPKKTGILRLYVWNGKRYADPKTGKKYDVRRTIIEVNGKKRRVKKLFKELSEAILWQQGESLKEMNDQFGSLEELAKRGVTSGDMKFGDVVKVFREEHLQTVAASTKHRYERLIDGFFPVLFPVAMNDFKPQVIDLWLSKLIGAERNCRRKSFKHEFEMLVTILKFYEEYFDEDSKFISPIKKRHKKKAQLGQNMVKVTPELTEEEFFRFRMKLMQVANGGILAILATLQYFQALRISEAAAVHGTDFQIDTGDISQSRFLCSRAIKWEKQTGNPTCEGGLKNGDYIGGVKEQPLLPETYRALSLIPNFEKIEGPLFLNTDDKWFTYRQIQRAYDRAFVLAGLSYTGTHIMRHGGCRALYNETGDLAVAKQHLGNKNLSSVLVYAHRRASALSEVVSKRWGEGGLVVNGTTDNFKK